MGGRVMPRLKTTVKVGDEVGYRVTFLRSIGMSHSEMARERGTVLSLEDFGSGRIARADFGCPHDPPEGRAVLENNLARPGTLQFTSEDH